MKLCIDLCSGLGGFSQAFVDAGWEVITVDIDPKFAPEIVADVRELSRLDILIASRLRKFDAYEKVVVLASPPCQAFSVANYAWPKKNIREGLEIVGACIELIRQIQPQYWCLENPRGRLRWFIGRPNSSVKLKNYGYRTWKYTDLWHNIPFSLVESDSSQESMHNEFPFRLSKKGTKRQPWDDKTKPSERARMPLGLSQAILETVEVAEIHNQPSKNP